MQNFPTLSNTQKYPDMLPFIGFLIMALISFM